MSSWRRNLEKFKNVALPVAGFALGGPGGAALGGALAGATGKGRPTFGNVAKGAGTGYVGGQLAGGLGIQGGQGFGAMASSGKSALMNPRASVSNLFTGGGGGGGTPPGRFASAATSLGNFVKDPVIAAGLAKGAGTAYAGQQAADAQLREIELLERKQNQAEQEYREEQERRRRVAQLLAPLFQQMYQQQGLSG